MKKRQISSEIEKLPRSSLSKTVSSPSECLRPFLLFICKTHFRSRLGQSSITLFHVTIPLPFASPSPIGTAMAFHSTGAKPAESRQPYTRLQQVPVSGYSSEHKNITNVTNTSVYSFGAHHSDIKCWTSTQSCLWNSAQQEDVGQVTGCLSRCLCSARPRE